MPYDLPVFPIGSPPNCRHYVACLGVAVYCDNIGLGKHKIRSEWMEAEQNYWLITMICAHVQFGLRLLESNTGYKIRRKVMTTPSPVPSHCILPKIWHQNFFSALLSGGNEDMFPRCRNGMCIWVVKGRHARAGFVRLGPQRACCLKTTPKVSYHWKDRCCNENRAKLGSSIPCGHRWIFLPTPLHPRIFPGVIKTCIEAERRGERGREVILTYLSFYLFIPASPEIFS